MADLNEGEAIPELRITPDKYLPHRYAGASGDFNPIHIDNDFATAVGLPRNILHGLWTMAQVARAQTEAAGGDPRSLRRLSVQFRGMGVPEEEIVVSGTVTSRDGDRAIVATEAVQGGNGIVRNAESAVDAVEDRVEDALEETGKAVVEASNEVTSVAQKTAAKTAKATAKAETRSRKAADSAKDTVDAAAQPAQRSTAQKTAAKKTAPAAKKAPAKATTARVTRARTARRADPTAVPAKKKNG